MIFFNAFIVKLEYIKKTIKLDKRFYGKYCKRLKKKVFLKYPPKGNIITWSSGVMCNYFKIKLVWIGYKTSESCMFINDSTSQSMFICFFFITRLHTFIFSLALIIIFTFCVLTRICFIHLCIFLNLTEKLCYFFINLCII